MSHNAVKVAQSHLLLLHQVADVWLRDANEAGGTAGRRLLLHRLSVLRSHCLCHRPWYICFFSYLQLMLVINQILFSESLKACCAYSSKGQRKVEMKV